MIKYGKKICAALMLICMFNTCAADVSAIDSERELVPVGVAAGIRLNTEGLIVVGLSSVNTDGKEIYPAKDAGVREGDAIISADGAVLESVEDLKNVVDKSGDNVKLVLLRAGQKINISVTPGVAQDGQRRIGVWVRDSMLGIGTITYYDQASQNYGALGHGISDPVTGNLISIRGGMLTDVKLTDILMGEKGSAGELKGEFTGEELGTIDKNTEAGIFGQLKLASEQKPLPICDSDSVQLGSAVLISSVSGRLEEYDIKIRAIYRGSGVNGRDMLIEVTDPDLISITGGIVRGMSGSPIVQNGRFVGAVTHVLVNDPHKGYAISITHMLEASGEESVRDTAA